MFCSKCGNEVKKSQHFCDNCGNKISLESPGNEVPFKYYNYEPKSNDIGLSVTGFILGLVALIISIALLICVNTDGFYREENIIIFGIFGITSAILLITGFILSVIGTVKTKDVFGIMGIILSICASISDTVTLLSAIFKIGK